MCVEFSKKLIKKSSILSQLLMGNLESRREMILEELFMLIGLLKKYLTLKIIVSMCGAGRKVTIKTVIPIYC